MRNALNLHDSFFETSAGLSHQQPSESKSYHLTMIWSDGYPVPLTSWGPSSPSTAPQLAAPNVNRGPMRPRSRQTSTAQRFFIEVVKGSHGCSKLLHGRARLLHGSRARRDGKESGRELRKLVLFQLPRATVLIDCELNFVLHANVSSWIVVFDQ